MKRKKQLKLEVDIYGRGATPSWDSFLDVKASMDGIKLLYDKQPPRNEKKSENFCFPLFELNNCNLSYDYILKKIVLFLVDNRKNIQTSGAEYICIALFADRLLHSFSITLLHETLLELASIQLPIEICIYPHGISRERYGKSVDGYLIWGVNGFLMEKMDMPSSLVRSLKKLNISSAYAQAFSLGEDLNINAKLQDLMTSYPDSFQENRVLVVAQYMGSYYFPVTNLSAETIQKAASSQCQVKLLFDFASKGPKLDIEI